MHDVPPYEIVLTRHVWERTVRHLLTRPNSFAVGSCRRNEHAGAAELLIDQLEFVDATPSGQSRPPLADWIVIGAPGQQPSFSVEELIAQIQPRRTQLLVVCLLGLGTELGGWRGAVVADEHIMPLEAIHVIGPRMLVVRRGISSSNPPEGPVPPRWSRTAGAIGEGTWRKLSETRVLLCGAGRNGSAMAYQLCALGIRQLTVVDPDTLAQENLDAMFSVQADDVGKPKVEAVQENLLAFRPDCAITSFVSSAAHRSFVDLARGTHLIVTCCDEDLPRLAAALLANRFLKIHVDAASGITADETGERLLAGDVRLLLPHQGCVCCVGGLRNEEQARYELFAPPGALRRGRRMAWHEQRLGSLITLNSMVVAVAAQLIIDLLAGDLRLSHWHRLRWVLGEGIQSDYSPVGPRPDCPVCQMHARSGQPAA